MLCAKSYHNWAIPLDKEGQVYVFVYKPDTGWELHSGRKIVLDESARESDLIMGF